MPHGFNRQNFQRFQFTQKDRPDLFVDKCKKVEADDNYQPSISNAELLDLVRDEEGHAVHDLTTRAMAIKPSAIKSDFGKVYDIKIALHGAAGSPEAPLGWHVNEDLVLLVHKHNGRITFHEREKAVLGDFNDPLTYLNEKQILNRESLHMNDVCGISFCTIV